GRARGRRRAGGRPRHLGLGGEELARGPGRGHAVIARSDVVGSLLRPSELLAAREDGDSERLGAAEDAAVDEVLRRQAEAGMAVVTDGEMRRLSFQSQMVEAVDGFGDWDLDAI